MYKHVIKRALGFIIALLSMPLLILVALVVGIAIKLDDGGPVFYNGYRLSKSDSRRGTVFPMYKFRSMKVNSPDIRLEDGSTFNSENDQRVTRVGRFLRKTSIDELPQLFNVLVGDMALIGPRPDLPSDLATYTKDEMIILSVRPGITGWNQAINRNSVGAKEKLEADIYYVNHLSFLFDCRILWLTIKTVLSHKDVFRA